MNGTISVDVNANGYIGPCLGLGFAIQPCLKRVYSIVSDFSWNMNAEKIGPLTCPTFMKVGSSKKCGDAFAESITIFDFLGSMVTDETVFRSSKTASTFEEWLLNALRDISPTWAHGFSTPLICEILRFRSWKLACQSWQDMSSSIRSESSPSQQWWRALTAQTVVVVSDEPAKPGGLEYLLILNPIWYDLHWLASSRCRFLAALCSNLCNQQVVPSCSA